MHPRFSRQKASIMVSSSWSVAFACLRPLLADCCQSRHPKLIREHAVAVRHRLFSLRRRPATFLEGPLATIERLWHEAQIRRLRWSRERHRDEVDSARPTTSRPNNQERGWITSMRFVIRRLRPISPIPTIVLCHRPGSLVRLNKHLSYPAPMTMGIESYNHTYPVTPSPSPEATSPCAFAYN